MKPRPLSAMQRHRLLWSGPVAERLDDWAESKSQSAALNADIESLYLLSTKQTVVKHKFTAEAKNALLQAVQVHSWTTAREAYGWAWNELGLRINYLTVWRFLAAQGLLVGDTPKARRLTNCNRVCA